MIPSSISVQGCDWPIKVVENLQDDHGRPCYGLCDFQNKTILISSNKKKIMISTLIHECLHAICEQSGLHQTYNWNYDFEEIMAEQLTNFLMSDSVNFSFKKEKDGDLKSKRVKK